MRPRFGIVDSGNVLFSAAMSLIKKNLASDAAGAHREWVQIESSEVLLKFCAALSDFAALDDAELEAMGILKGWTVTECRRLVIEQSSYVLGALSARVDHRSLTGSMQDLPAIVGYRDRLARRQLCSWSQVSCESHTSAANGASLSSSRRARRSGMWRSISATKRSLWVRGGDSVDVHVQEKILQIWSGNELIKTVVRTREGQVRKK